MGPSASFKTKAAKLGTVPPNLTIDWMGSETQVMGLELGNAPTSGDGASRPLVASA